MKNNKWVAMWGNAISIANRRPENYAKNLTLRYPIRSVFNGSALKFTFSNFCGTEAITITKAFVAKSFSDRNIDVDSSVSITFKGDPSVQIPAGEEIVSDEIPFNVGVGENISISMYFNDFTEMRSAVNITGPLSKGYFSVGDFSESADLPLDLTRNTQWFYFLSNIDVLTEDKNRAVICYGDSITSQAWPDYLTQKVLHENHNNTSIIRRAASGTRILRQYDCITYDSYGLKGSIRFPREAKVSGANTIIIQHGINDIIHPVGVDLNPFRPWSDMPTAEQLINGLREYIDIAKEYGLKVYIGTLLPIYGWRTYEQFREDIRLSVNEWIRTTKEIDGCIDFDKALRDDLNLSKFAAEYDSGDHLHPSLKGYEKMASIIPEEILTGIY